MVVAFNLALEIENHLVPGAAYPDRNTRAALRYTEGLSDPQGLSVLNRCPFQHSSCFWA
jgi:hypothetical protein